MQRILKGQKIGLEIHFNITRKRKQVKKGIMVEEKVTKLLQIINLN